MWTVDDELERSSSGDVERAASDPPVMLVAAEARSGGRRRPEHKGEQIQSSLAAIFLNVHQNQNETTFPFPFAPSLTYGGIFFFPVSVCSMGAKSNRQSFSFCVFVSHFVIPASTNPHVLFHE